MLNKDEILKRTNKGLDVFRHYISGEWRVGRNFLNPLYEDRKASCNIYFDRRSFSYKMKDFGNDAYSGDCFFIVGKIKGLNCNNPADFIEILKTINRDLNLGLNDTCNSVFVSTKMITKFPPKQPEATKKIKPYSVEQKPFSAKELSFWQQYGISFDLKRAVKV